jgi:hypothetical protein
MASAWQSLVRHNPAAAPQILARLKAREGEAARLDVAYPGAHATSASQFKELAKLTDMLEKGQLSREEFDLIKARILGTKKQRRTVAERAALRRGGVLSWPAGTRR